MQPSIQNFHTSLWRPSFAKIRNAYVLNNSGRRETGANLFQPTPLSRDDWCVHVIIFVRDLDMLNSFVLSPALSQAKDVSPPCTLWAPMCLETTREEMIG
jgi:hypothetical protein